MGMNTTIIVMNDCLYDIERDIDFGKKISEAVSMLPRNKPVDVGGAKVIETHHSSYLLPVLVGGNTGRVLDAGVISSDDFLSEDVKILKSLASTLGYRLVKK